MKELEKIAANYAAGKANEAIDKAIAQAYADGYRDGYKDREEEIPVDLRDNKTEFVDLGLPSGTLWAKEYEKTENGFLYLPYIQAKGYNLPTRIQWEELVTECCWGRYGKAIRCTGKNGRWIDFLKTGGLCPSYNDGDKSYLWLLGDSIEAQNELACIVDYSYMIIVKTFMGYKYPIRQVK